MHLFCESCQCDRLYCRVLLLLLICISSEVLLITCNPIVVVVSFDGFRADYVNRSLTPNLYSLAQNGVKGVMKSTFVTKTYPNHQSIATGYYEEIHGIVNNAMYDQKLNETFDVDKSSSLWWDNNISVPIWIANEQMRGIDGSLRLSGSMMWPGSHASYGGKTIHYLQEYNASLTWNDRIDMIIEWLTHPLESANCVFAYFDEPDTTAHEYGPFGFQTLEQVKRVDKLMGYLLMKLESSKLLRRTNLILVSDHGMTEIRKDNVIQLNLFLNNSWYEIHGSSPVWSVLPKTGYEEIVFETLHNASKSMNFSVYMREDIPREYHYNSHPRILPIFMVADEGFDIYQNMSWKPKGYPIWGNHGYNNSLSSMRPLFIASGPAFKSAYEHKKHFLNIDLYPLMCHILQLFPLKLKSNGTLVNVIEMIVPSIHVEAYDESAQKWYNLILFIFGGFGVLFIGSVCFVCSASAGKALRKPKPSEVMWDDVSPGLDIDLRSHLNDSIPNNTNAHNQFNDDDVISRAKRLQRPEETLLLLQDDDEEDL